MHEELSDDDRDEQLGLLHYSCVCRVADFAWGKDDDDELPGLLEEYWSLSGEAFLATNYEWARPEYADVCLAELAWRSLKQIGLHVELLSSEPEAMMAHVRTVSPDPIDARIRDALPAWLGVRLARCYPAGTGTWLVCLDREIPERNRP